VREEADGGCLGEGFGGRGLFRAAGQSAANADAEREGL